MADLFKVLLFLVLCGAARCVVFNDVPTVTKARCYANCITEVSKSTGPDPGCLGNACRQCVSYCDRKFTTTGSCSAKCKQSSICLNSCDFLAHLKSLPSVFNGNNSLTIQPGVPMATAKNFSSLMLSWKPTTSTTGSVVYLLKKRFHGDIKGSLVDLKNLVFTQPKAVLNVRDMCRNSPLYRNSWDGVQFTFQVIALTEYSHLVGSPESTQIEMTRPEPVTAIGTPSFSYDTETYGDKIKMTTVVTPFEAQASLISQYAMEWSMFYCQSPIVPSRSSSSNGASTTISIYLYEKLKSCNHTLKVYSLNQCIPSLPRTLIYEYKGCRFVENFNKTFCYSFDPPPTPDSARAVGSLAYSPLKATLDYRFNTNITWSPPTFPYGKLQYYTYALGDVSKMLFGIIWMARRGSTKETSFNALNLEPNITVRVEITPRFANTYGVVRKITFQTPGIPKNQLVVRHLTADDFVFTQTNLFSVRVHWQKPLSDNQLQGYQIDFLKGNASEKTVTTKETFYVFHGLMHNEPLVIEVKPLYAVRWIKPKEVVLRLKAPAAKSEDITVRNLVLQNFTYNAHMNTFTAYFLWDPPSYSYKTVDHYEVGYIVVGGNAKQKITCPSHDAEKAKLCMPATTRKCRYSIQNVHPHVHIVIWVKPVFKNSPFLNGIKVTFTIDVPYAPGLFCGGKPAGYYADEKDCTAFYQCDSNGGTFHMFCPAGLYWNANITGCDWPSNVNCQKKEQKCCQGKPAGYYKDEKNLSAYCECHGKGRGFVRVCSSGLNWNENRKACTLPKSHQPYQDQVLH